MKFGDFELKTGGKFNLEEILSSHTEIDADGNSVVHLTPELYDMMIEEWSLKETKKLSDERIKQICDFYKGKYIFCFSDEYKPFISEGNVEDEGVHYMLADHVEFDKSSFVFTVFTKAVLIYLDNDCYPLVATPNEDGFFEYDIPIYMNNIFIDIESEDMISDIGEFKTICEECLKNLNYTGQCLIELYSNIIFDPSKIRHIEIPRKKKRKKKNKKPKNQDKQLEQNEPNEPTNPEK